MQCAHLSCNDNILRHVINVAASGVGAGVYSSLQDEPFIIGAVNGIMTYSIGLLATKATKALLQCFRFIQPTPPQEPSCQRSYKGTMLKTSVIFIAGFAPSAFLVRTGFTPVISYKNIFCSQLAGAGSIAAITNTIAVYTCLSNCSWQNFSQLFRRSVNPGHPQLTIQIPLEEKDFINSNPA